MFSPTKHAVQVSHEIEEAVVQLHANTTHANIISIVNECRFCIL